MFLYTSQRKHHRNFWPLDRDPGLKLGSGNGSQGVDTHHLRDFNRHMAAPSYQHLRKKRNIVIIGVVIFTSLLFLLLSGPQEAAQSFKSVAFKPKTKALVLATIQKQNVTWLEKVPEDWQVIRYIADDPLAEHSVPVSQGHEAMPYITFVLDYYDRLPDYVVFAHGHERSWHQPEPMQYILQALNLRILDQLGLVSLRCALQNTCEAPERHVRPIESIKWDLSAILVRMHEFVFRPEDSWYEPLPEAFAFPCCGQFAVTKKQILKKPKDYWRRIHMILTRNFAVDFQDWEIGKGGPDISWKLGGVFEFTWPWWFSMPSIVCLDTDYCRRTVFQNKIHCDGKTWDWTTAQPIWRNITCTLDD